MHPAQKSAILTALGCAALLAPAAAVSANIQICNVVPAEDPAQTFFLDADNTTFISPPIEYTSCWIAQGVHLGPYARWMAKVQVKMRGVSPRPTVLQVNAAHPEHIWMITPTSDSNRTRSYGASIVSMFNPASNDQTYDMAALNACPGMGEVVFLPPNGTAAWLEIGTTSVMPVRSVDVATKPETFSLDVGGLPSYQVTVARSGPFGSTGVITCHGVRGNNEFPLTIGVFGTAPAPAPSPYKLVTVEICNVLPTSQRVIVTFNTATGDWISTPRLAYDECFTAQDVNVGSHEMFAANFNLLVGSAYISGVAYINTAHPTAVWVVAPTSDREAYGYDAAVVDSYNASSTDLSYDLGGLNACVDNDDALIIPLAGGSVSLPLGGRHTFAVQRDAAFMFVADDITTKKLVVDKATPPGASGVAVCQGIHGSEAWPVQYRMLGTPPQPQPTPSPAPRPSSSPMPWPSSSPMPTFMPTWMPTPLDEEEPEAKPKQQKKRKLRKSRRHRKRKARAMPSKQ